MREELKPKDCHKSFYKKCYVWNLKDKRVLYSYETPVMMEKEGKYYRLSHEMAMDEEKKALLESATTLRHVRAFSGLNKKQYLALPFAD